MGDPDFSDREVTTFRDRDLPMPAALAGYAALLEAYELAIPMPQRLFAVTERARGTKTATWRVLAASRRPAPNLGGHLVFAVEQEGIDLLVLKRVFRAAGRAAVTEIVVANPSGKHERRLWFLYEWLLGARLPIPGLRSGAFVDVLNAKMQVAGDGEKIPRYRVRNNLPGTPEFCPLAFRTPKIEALGADALWQRTAERIGDLSSDLLDRLGSVLAVEESEASFELGDEAPAGPHRTQAWADALRRAGRHDLSRDDITTLEGIVLGDDRTVQLGPRVTGSWVSGEENRARTAGAQPGDLPMLTAGLLSYARRTARRQDPVVSAAAIAFGFLRQAPLEDGNSRIHRYLVHHALTQGAFCPPGLPFPVSLAMLRRHREYRQLCEEFTSRLRPHVEAVLDPNTGEDRHHATSDFYRFFDVTTASEFLYECLREVVAEDVPRELDALERFDAFSSLVGARFALDGEQTRASYLALRAHGGQWPSQPVAGLDDATRQALAEIFRDLV